MTRTERMQRIVTLTEVARQGASQRFRHSSQAHVAACQKRDQFLQYRAEYQRELEGAGTAMSAARACELRRFIAQVDAAVAALEAECDQTEARRRADLEDLNRVSGKRRALGDVLDRARRADAEESEARDQRESDDRSAARREHR
ncbi:MAG: flagellar export protein FliJ [Gammaproteobacteria bacterium]